MGAAAAGRTASPGSPFRNAHTDVAFVGDAACFDCHEDEYRGFQEHGMAQSFYPLTPENAVEDFSGVVVPHAASGYYYRPYAEEGRFYQEEYRLDANGARTHRLVREIKYVVGSGTAARTYLAEENGRLYELPLTWYTQQEKWDFSPGYRERNSRFERLIPDRCMACHNSYPEPVPFAEGKYASVPHGIGCERCHGPGALHIEERLANPEPADSIDYTIVNPAHLSLDRRLDVCQQCHLHTSVSVLREGRDAYDFRPSQDLASYVAFFAEEEQGGEEQLSVISHADRMKQSACFLETRTSPRPMDCTTCHNPHEGFRTQGAAYFNETCQTCHAGPGLQAQLTSAEARRVHTPDANCIACHMPRVEVEDAPHASFTDHKIRVVEQVRTTAPAPAAASAKLAAYFARDREGTEGAIYEGVAYIVFGKQRGDSLALEKGIALLEEALPQTQGHGEAHFLLGLAHLQLGRVAAAIPPLETAVRHNADVPERLNTLAQAYEAAGRDPVKIERLYQRALALQPALAEVRVNYGRFLEARGRLPEAIEAYRQAAEEQPWLATAHFNLGTAYLRSGAPAEAEAALQEAIALEPGYVEARGNLGMLYASGGQPGKARAQFEAAVQAAPENPVALGNLGAFYLNEQAPERAIPLLERAVRANPRYADGLVNLALAYYQRGNAAQARSYAQQVLTLDPANARARQILAAL